MRWVTAFSAFSPSHTPLNPLRFPFKGGVLDEDLSKNVSFAALPTGSLNLVAMIRAITQSTIALFIIRGAAIAHGPDRIVVTVFNPSV